MDFAQILDSYFDVDLRSVQKKGSGRKNGKKGSGRKMIQNSEARFLLGYQQELKENLTLGTQAYAEWLQEYDAYRDSLSAGERARDEWRQLLTLRLTSLHLNQTLMLSGFVFYSPTDEDIYTRLLAEYKWSDEITLSAGANLFAGRSPETFFGQFEDNSNLYLAVRRWW